MSKEDSDGEGKSQDASSPDASAKDPNADIYENRKPKKIIRVVTVMAYLFSVSFVGILLSAYYIFLWEPPNPRLMRSHLRADPQMQFLMSPPAERTDLTTKDGGLLPQSEVDRVHKPFLLSRIAYDGEDPAVDPRDKPDQEKQRRLNTALLKLRHSLVDTLRAQRRNSSRETAIPSGQFDNSFVRAGTVFNSTRDRAGNATSRHGESGKETYGDNADSPPEFADSTSTLGVESTSRFTTIPGTETSESHFGGDSVTSVNPFTEGKNRERKLDAVGSHLARGFSNATTSHDVTTGGDHHRVFGGNNSSRMIQEFLKIGRKEPMERNKTDDRQLVSDLSDLPASVTSEQGVNGGIQNPQESYSNVGSSSEGRIGQITRDTVSIDPSSRNLGFTDGPGFHQTPDKPAVIESRSRTAGTRNSEEAAFSRFPPVFLVIRNLHQGIAALCLSKKRSRGCAVTFY
ncbi:PREDICTED: uncharacterized protein LOC105564463 isoform X2 [Vollenhovia emeryi]|uniref:uncharacterized protein LOC105564463 isoform X2 n=1 Tax=Vollenhovia emeryi TaxID=411798 RepID=UPI0005F4FE70|nr:PREDICTED: uncharacterized protein LOC105564463 isoform X2 [Vollenhovia emeryi]